MTAGVTNATANGVTDTLLGETRNPSIIRQTLSFGDPLDSAGSARPLLEQIDD
jgi:hypothetical protein